MSELSSFQQIALVSLVMALVFATTPAWPFFWAAIKGTSQFCVHVCVYIKTRRTQPCAGQTWTNGTGDVYQIIKTYGPCAAGGVVVRTPHSFQSVTISKDRWCAFRGSQFLIPINPDEIDTETNNQD